MQNKRILGSMHESAACQYLAQQGFCILEQNYFCKFGEIDIIAKDQEYLVFLEVKYRSSDISGYPEEAVNLRKMKRIIRSAKYYLMVHNRTEDIPCRFDVIAILGTEITHIRDAFQLR